ncbi:hypothetical protein NLN82_24630 [Citrobacter portucalensis]|uniref:hypothetical protein n=1 Tax=Citrobacter portucalensis TaxID=1639133 RepID=UPI00226B8C8C|nr:hypothetical protein [Citrobacter portucalensis]MCX8971697.1 hypothetical protein [Citrobacter portucalensis]MCX9039206.1 hypothetical protein [Citrobacter portucalensis]
MATENIDAIAQEVSDYPRIIHKNQFVNCLQAVCSEWLQLLLVVEHIKLNVQANKTLDDVVAIAKEVLAHPQIQESYGHKPSDNAVRNDTAWNPQVDEKIRALDAATTLFDTLDQGGKINAYFAAVHKVDFSIFVRKTEENSFLTIATEAIPAILDVQNFSWNNLNAWRLGYPHQLIVRSIVFNDDLLSAIDALLTFAENDVLFDALRMKTIQAYVQRKTIQEGAFYHLGCHFLANRADIVAEVNHQILLATAQRCLILARAIPVSIGLPAVILDHQFRMQVSPPENIKTNLGRFLEPEKERKVVNIQMDVEDFTCAINNDASSEFFRQLNEMLFASIRPEVKNSYGKYSDIDLPSWLYQAIWKYKGWVEQSSHILLLGNKEDYLAARIILRGVKFSNWDWYHRTPGKVSIEKKLAQYKTEGESESTIKQSYEKVRGYAKNKITGLVINQLEERQNMRNMMAEGLQTPLNHRVIEKCSRFCNVLARYFPRDIFHQHGLRWCLEGAGKLVEKLNSSDASDALLRHHLYDCFALDDHTRSMLSAGDEPLDIVDIHELRSLLKQPLLS